MIIFLINLLPEPGQASLWFFLQLGYYKIIKFLKLRIFFENFKSIPQLDLDLTNIRKLKVWFLHIDLLSKYI